MFNIIEDKVEGRFEVEFTNGLVRPIDVERQVIDTRNFPMWLVSTQGTHYNYQNIISIRKIS